MKGIAASLGAKSSFVVGFVLAVVLMVILRFFGIL